MTEEFNKVGISIGILLSGKKKTSKRKEKNLYVFGFWGILILIEIWIKDQANIWQSKNSPLKRWGHPND